jgi:WD40 repeat protein
MDSRLFASASQDGSVRLWDRKGQLVRVLAGSDPVFSLAWSPDDTILAVGAIHMPGATPWPGVITLWRPDGTRLATVGTDLTGGKFLNLGWSPDGSLLAAGAVDYADWRTDGSSVGVLRNGGAPAWAMAWSPDSGSLALGDENGSLMLVSTAGVELGSAQLQGDVNALSYAPDGQGLAVGTNGQVRFVSVADPTTAIWSVATADEGHVAWSPDGHRLAIAVTNGLAILSAEGSPVATLTGCAGSSVAFAWSRSNLAAATAEGRLCVWKAP